MAIVITKKVQAKVKVDTARGVYSDALYYPEGEVPIDKDIETAAQARADGWIFKINNPVTPAEPTKKELEDMIANLEEQQSYYQDKLDTINAG